MKKIGYILIFACCVLVTKVSYSQAIQLEKPSLGLVWPAYSIQKIKWNAANIENIKIEASLDSGRNWTTIQESYPASAGYYEWEIPFKVSDSCYVRVSDVLNPGSSSSNYKNNPFKIPAPSISLEDLETIYYANQQLPISWTVSGVKKVNLFLSYDNKVSFKKIASNVLANAISYNHILSDTLASKCFIAIVDSANNKVSDTNQISFSVLRAIIGRLSKFHGGSFDGHATKNNLASSLDLTYPNKYDSLIGGQKITITWKANNIDNIDLLYSNDSLRTWNIMDSNISAQALRYEWKIPNIPTNYGKIKIRDSRDHSISDISDTCFMIRKKTLNLKTTTDTIYKNTVMPIYWSSVGVEKIKIYIQQNLIADSINALNEVFNWVVPNDIASQFSIKIMDIADTTILDSSLSYQTNTLPVTIKSKYKGGNYDGHSYKSNIKGNVNLVYPNGGERLAKAGSIILKWSSSEIDYLKLYYSLDSGTNWILVDSNIVANLGYYNWQLPNTPSDKVLTKLVYASDNSIFDYANNTFTIIDKKMQLELDKTSWIKNAENQIKWNTFGVEGIKIIYKEKDSLKWKIITNNILTNAELYNWQTPNLLSDSIYIKIIDNLDSNVFAIDTLQLKIKTNNLTQSAFKFKGGKFDGHSYKSNINKVIINKPAANEILVSGKPYSLNWDFINLNDTVLLQYSIDSGKTWINIEKVPAVLGTYEWVIPVSNYTGNSINELGAVRKSILASGNINSDMCLIRVLDIKAGNEVVGMSKSSFSIKSSTTVSKAFINFTSISNINWTGANIYMKLLASTNSGDTVKYYISNGKNASISNDTVIIKGPGTITIGSYDLGNMNYTKSDTVLQTFCVTPPKPTLNIYSKTICSNDSVMLSASSGYTSYLWTNNDTARILHIKKTSQLQVKGIVDNCASPLSDIVAIEVINIPATPSITRDLNGNLVSSSSNWNLWYKDGVQLPDTAQVFKPISNGYYTVKAGQKTCYSSISNGYYFIVTDLLLLDNNQYIKIDPNPFIDQLTIRFLLKEYSNLQLEVFNIGSGEKVLTNKRLYSESKLQLGNLSKGYYLFLFSSPDYKKHYQFKMLKL